MAGPSVAVRVLADMAGLGQGFKSAGDAAGAATEKIHGAFSSVLDTLNKTGVLGGFGEALDGINGAFDKIIGKGKDVGQAMLGVGGALVGVGAGLQAIGSKDQAAHQQLQAAVQATGADYEDYAGQVEKAIKTNEHYGNTADQTQNALQSLTQATHDPQKAIDLLAVSTDVAASKHEDLQTAADQVGKVFNGNTKLLKPYGIEIDKTTGLTKDGKTATQALADVTKGQASAAADTFAGKLKGIKAGVEDAAASFGQKYGPAITAAGAVMTGLGATMEVTKGIMGLFAGTQEAVSVAEGLAATAAGVEGGAMDVTAASATAADAAALPMIVTIGLIVAGVALLGLAAYELYTHWSQVWGWIKQAAVDVWDWIKANWPLLVGILLGPFGVAAALIYQHWQTIKDGAATAVQWVKDRFNDLVGFFTGLPGRLAGIFAGMWNGIFDAFHRVINQVINLWNQLHFTLPHIDLGPLGSIGGGTIGVPYISPLASGGIVTRPTLALIGEAGPEAVVPLGKGLGPAVHIEHAYFQDQVDVDLLMSRAAWAARTRAV